MLMIGKNEPSIRAQRRWVKRPMAKTQHSAAIKPPASLWRTGELSQGKHEDPLLSLWSAPSNHSPALNSARMSSIRQSKENTDGFGASFIQAGTHTVGHLSWFDGGFSHVSLLSHHRLVRFMLRIVIVWCDAQILGAPCGHSVRRLATAMRQRDGNLRSPVDFGADAVRIYLISSSNHFVKNVEFISRPTKVI